MILKVFGAKEELVLCIEDTKIILDQAYSAKLGINKCHMNTLGPLMISQKQDWKTIIVETLKIVEIQFGVSQLTLKFSGSIVIQFMSYHKQKNKILTLLKKSVKKLFQELIMTWVTLAHHHLLLAALHARIGHLKNHIHTVIYLRRMKMPT